MQEKTFQDLAKEAWQIYTTYFSKFLLLALILFLPINALYEFAGATDPFQQQMIAVEQTVYEDSTGAFDWSAFQKDFSAAMEWTPQNIVSFVASGLLMVAGLVVSILIALLVKEVKEQHTSVDLRKLIQKSKQFWWPTITTGIIEAFLTGMLFLLFIIPGVIFSVYWIFANILVILKKKKNIGALQYSKQLVKGRWWEVVWRLGLIALLIMLVTIMIAVPTDSLVTTVPGMETLVTTITELVWMYFSVFLVVYCMDLIHTKETETDQPASVSESKAN